jgi:hypothetical protein
MDTLPHTTGGGKIPLAQVVPDTDFRFYLTSIMLAAILALLAFVAYKTTRWSSPREVVGHRTSSRPRTSTASDTTRYAEPTPETTISARRYRVV